MFYFFVKSVDVGLEPYLWGTCFGENFNDVDNAIGFCESMEDLFPQPVEAVATLLLLLLLLLLRHTDADWELEQADNCAKLEGFPIPLDFRAKKKKRK